MKNKLKNFLRGLGSSFSLYQPRSERMKKILEQTDAEAIASDWQAVGDGIRVQLELKTNNKHKSNDKFKLLQAQIDKIDTEYRKKLKRIDFITNITIILVILCFFILSLES